MRSAPARGSPTLRRRQRPNGAAERDIPIAGLGGLRLLVHSLLPPCYPREILLLPRKKQRVLDAIARVLKHYRTETLRTRDHARQAVIDDLTALLTRPAD